MSSWRLPRGGTIDRTRPLTFHWNGRRFTGYEGDTLASALLACGVSMVGRSFKYHRPRGVLGGGFEEPNAIVTLEDGPDTLTNLRATQVQLYEGLRARSVNAWPNLDLDLLGINGWFKRFLPAGFYYKTFMWPSWRLFEPAIRQAAGLGQAPREADPDNYIQAHAHCDVLVIGAGTAGLAAAQSAAAAGWSVILADALPVPGGSAIGGGKAIADAAARHPNVRYLPRTTAFGVYDHNLVGLLEQVQDHIPPQRRSGPRQRLWKVRAGRVVMATGAFERPLLFERNDLPGIMLASAGLTYLRRHAVAPGRRVVIATNNDTAYDVAAELAAAGVEIAALIDSREVASRRSAFGVITGSRIRAARGWRHVKAVRVERGGSGMMDIACDAVLVSGGWNPNVHLYSQAGGRLAWSDAQAAFLPVDRHSPLEVVGMAADVPLAGPVLPRSAGRTEAFASWIDYQNDVTLGDVQLAVQENFRSVEHVKRYTTLGMATDQGKTSNVAGIMAIAEQTGRSPGEVGTTRFRPPFDPVTIGAFAAHRTGENLLPVRTTALHDQHLARGGVMEDYGRWQRPAYFPRADEGEAEAVAREVLAVREAVGVFDASPLGKIEVKGRDAATFLDRIYVQRLANLKPGRLRYGIVLREDGIVFDDGVVARLAPDHFLVGTTSARSAAVADMLDEWLQCEWPQFDVVIEDVTAQRSVICVTGPKARELLARLEPGIDLSREAFGHMSWRDGVIGGVPCRIQRVSFTGEVSYEIALPWRTGPGLWERLLDVGRDLGVTPFGIEAMNVLRMEKGYLHLGTDTDGTTYPQDIGLAPVIARKPEDFVGRRSTMRANGADPCRRAFVGLAPSDNGGALRAGAHVLALTSTMTSGQSAGWVTSSAWSPTLGKPVALAMISSGRERLGEEVTLWDLGQTRRARIVDPRFYDPEGSRVHG